MKKIIGVSLCCMLLVFSILSNAAIINNNEGVKEKNNINQLNGFNTINIDETTIKITLQPEEFEFGAITNEIGTFATISQSDYGYHLVEGKAKLPVIRKMIEIPYGSIPEIQQTSISWQYTSLEELGLPEKIVPAQISTEKIPEPFNGFVMDEKYYSTDAFLPETVGKIIETGTIRARNFSLVEISPIQYNPATGDLKILESCEFTMTLPNSDLERTYERINRFSTPSYERLFEITFQNYGYYEKNNLNRDTECILFIVDDDFEDELQPLVDIKIEKGFDATVTKTSEISGGATKENIYDFIEEAYDNWNIPPAYVLLVGDTQQIPTFYGSSSSSEADLYYVTVDGSDYFPDIHIGRFPGSQESHIQAMVEKTVYYLEANFENNDWIKKGAFIASSDAGQLAEQTHNHVIETYLEPNGYECDKIYEASGGSTSDITEALNEGRSLCIYSGHGYSGGWGCVPYNQNNVGNLVNFGMYPFVCSHACTTNPFGNSECFGETWLREPEKAGIGFWGASASTYWDEDDILERAMFQAWWDDGLEWMGGMTDMALFYLYEYYSGGGRTKYYYEAYNLNGDPSLCLWSDNPTLPPEKPTTPVGPEEWIREASATFSSSAVDPEGSSVSYWFDWGDGTNSGWIGPYGSGQIGEASHTWTELGQFEVKVQAKDNFGVRSEWSDSAFIEIVTNEPPDKPIITGPNRIEAHKLKDYTIVTDDPEGHDIYYMIQWGDGFSMHDTGPYSSGETVTFSHAWAENTDYTIIVKAGDIYGAESPQASLKISVIKDRAFSNNLLLSLFQRIVNQFPIIKLISALLY